MSRFQLLAQGGQQPQCGSGFALSQMHPDLADGQFVALGQVGGGGQLALAQQHQDLGRRHFGDAVDELFLAGGLFGLGDDEGRAVYIVLGKFHAGQKELADNKAINHLIILLGQVEALTTMLLSSSQVVPFVEDTGQTKLGIIDNLQRLLPGPV